MDVDPGQGSGSYKPFADGDLRRRLMARIGAPLTDGQGLTDTSEESVASEVFNSLVSSVYTAAGADTSVPQEKPNGAPR